jgi:glyoxylate carboligase
LGSYSAKTLEDVNLSVSSTLTDGKVVLTTTLTKEGLAGLQVIMNYDNTKLQLDNVVFDTGNTMTNFSTDKDGRLTFGSIDQLKTARIKKGTPYKLIFTPKVQLTNTAGLFFFVLSDAVDATGKKVNLIVE